MITIIVQIEHVIKKNLIYQIYGQSSYWLSWELSSLVYHLMDLGHNVFRSKIRRYVPHVFVCSITSLCDFVWEYSLFRMLVNVHFTIPKYSIPDSSNTCMKYTLWMSMIVSNVGPNIEQKIYGLSYTPMDPWIQLLLVDIPPVTKKKYIRSTWCAPRKLCF